MTARRAPGPGGWPRGSPRDWPFGGGGGGGAQGAALTRPRRRAPGAAAARRATSSSRRIRRPSPRWRRVTARPSRSGSPRARSSPSAAPRSTLMSNDAAVDHLSGDTMVRSMMAVTDPAIGADQVMGGHACGPGLDHGPRRRRGAHRFGRAQPQGAAGPDRRQLRFHGRQRARASTSWGTARTWPASSAAATATSAASRRARRSSA